MSIWFIIGFFVVLLILILKTLEEIRDSKVTDREEHETYQLTSEETEKDRSNDMKKSFLIAGIFLSILILIVLIAK